MPIKLGVIMDPIGKIHYKKDSTLAMLLEAKQRHYELYYFEQKDLYLKNDKPLGKARLLNVHHNPQHFFDFEGEQEIELGELDIILMRKDPPFDDTYIYTTYILEHAERKGTLVVNRAQSLRDANEKMFISYFPQCIPPTLVTQSVDQLYDFWQEHQDIVCKPLNTMGGTMVFRLNAKEVNANVIFDTLTHHENFFIMAQRFIPEITAGDKRIILINGDPIPHVLTRVPQGRDWRGNLAVGAKGTIEPLSEADRHICDLLSETLRKRGLYFVGIDVIGKYLTEINVTSPTGIRELDMGLDINISARLFDALEPLLRTHH